MKRPLADKVQEAIRSSKVINPEEYKTLDITYNNETEELHINRELGWSSGIIRSLLKITDRFFLVFFVKDQNTIIIHRS